MERSRRGLEKSQTRFRLVVLASRVRGHRGSAPLIRRLPTAVVAAAVLFAVLYVVVIVRQVPASGAGNWRTTTFGSAINDPGSSIADPNVVVRQFPAPETGT